jgi:hypothetical protein
MSSGNNSSMCPNVGVFPAINFALFYVESLIKQIRLKNEVQADEVVSFIENHQKTFTQQVSESFDVVLHVAGTSRHVRVDVFHFRNDEEKKKFLQIVYNAMSDAYSFPLFFVEIFSVKIHGECVYTFSERSSAKLPPRANNDAIFDSLVNSMMNLVKFLEEKNKKCIDRFIFTTNPSNPVKVSTLKLDLTGNNKIRIDFAVLLSQMLLPSPAVKLGPEFILEKIAKGEEEFVKSMTVHSGWNKNWPYFMMAFKWCMGGDLLGVASEVEKFIVEVNTRFPAPSDVEVVKNNTPIIVKFSRRVVNMANNDQITPMTVPFSFNSSSPCNNFVNNIVPSKSEQEDKMDIDENEEEDEDYENEIFRINKMHTVIEWLNENGCKKIFIPVDQRLGEKVLEWLENLKMKMTGSFEIVETLREADTAIVSFNGFFPVRAYEKVVNLTLIFGRRTTGLPASLADSVIELANFF